MGWVRKRKSVTALGQMNLNDATDPLVTYIQSANVEATPERNYPFTEAGVCEVLPYSASSTDRVIQRYTTWSTLHVYLRSRFNGTWGAWKKVGS